MILNNIAVTVALSLAFNLVVTDVFAAQPTADWELEQLHNPSSALLAHEDRGRITIYDGVTVTEVNKAMDDQFDRIDSMMFVRTLHPVADGAYYADDDCD